MIVGGALEGVAVEEGSFFVAVVAELFEDLEQFVDGVGAVGDARHLIDNIYYHNNTKSRISPVDPL